MVCAAGGDAKRGRGNGGHSYSCAISTYSSITNFCPLTIFKTKKEAVGFWNTGTKQDLIKRLAKVAEDHKLHSVKKEIERVIK